MRVFVIDVKECKAFATDIDDQLEEFYRIIGCDCIDIVVRTINGKSFDIICDDECLLKPNTVSAVDSKNKPMLVGNLIVCNYGGGGELAELSEDDVKHLEDSYTIASDGRTIFPVLRNVEY